MPGYPRAWDRLPDDSPEGFALRRHIAAEEAKAARRARLVRAGRAGAKAGMVGGAAATGALAGSVIGSKLDRKKGGKKKMGSVVEKSLGLFARPMTMRRAKAAGRLARIKADGAAVGAARGTGRATRYMNANAMPLLVGGSIGGGATMAGMQMSDRRKNMSKSDNEYVYVAERLSKRLPSALRAFRAAGSTGRAPGGTYGATRVTANTIGRQGKATATRRWESQFGPGTLSRSRRAGSTSGTGKLGVESGAAARGVAARKKRGQLVAARRPGQPGQRVLP